MGQVVKNVYGEALFEAAEDLGVIDAIYDEFSSLVDVLKDEVKLKVLLETPRISTAEKIELIDKVFKGKYSDILVNFLKVITEKRRIPYIFDIYESFKKIYIAYNDIMVANVVSAQKLSDEQINNLVVKLEELSDKKVEIYNIVDESVIGGMRIEADGRIIDGTISSKLSVMKDSLKEIVLNTDRSI